MEAESLRFRSGIDALAAGAEDFMRAQVRTPGGPQCVQFAARALRAYATYPGCCRRQSRHMRTVSGHSLCYHQGHRVAELRRSVPVCARRAMPALGRCGRPRTCSFAPTTSWRVCARPWRPSPRARPPRRPASSRCAGSCSARSRSCRRARRPLPSIRTRHGRSGTEAYTQAARPG